MEIQARLIKVENRNVEVVRREDTQERASGGGAFLVGAGIAGGIALLHNAAKNQRHQEELRQKYQQGRLDERWKMQQTVFAKDLEIAHLNNQLAEWNIQSEKKDVQIAQLTATAESLSATVKAQALQNSAKIFPQDDSDIGLN